MILPIDGTYTPGELRQAYAEKARSLFDQNQRLRGRYSRLNLVLLSVAAVLGILAATLKASFGFWCAIGAAIVSILTLMLRATPKAVDHALSAMTYLQYAQKFESMNNLDALPSTIDAFEQETSWRA